MELKEEQVKNGFVHFGVLKKDEHNTIIYDKI